MTKEIQEIGTSPGTNQVRRWIVPGSGTMKYTVVKVNSPSDVSREWQCSCPAWTRHIPRTHCKHILRVHEEFGINSAAYDAMMEKFAAKAKALKQGGMAYVKFEPKTPAPKPAPTGRKFR